MINKLRAAYKGKKVYLTGHTGFKGSWLLMILNYLGAEVKGYALAPEQEPDLFDLLNGNKLCESIIGDIRDLAHLEKELQSFQPDFIFHLAAQALVRKSFEAPLDTFATNITGTANLLDAARRLNNKCTIVVVTTDKVYENMEAGKPYSEDDPLGGYDPYSSSKACAEIVTSSYRRSFFNPAKFSEHQKAMATARAGNVIGGGDWSADRIIPDLIRALDSNKPLEVRNPASIRPWQHVLEPLSGYLLLGALLDEDAVKYGKAYNFGPEISDNLTVKELVDKAIKIWGKGEYIDASKPDAPHEAKLLHLDITRAINELGWKPKMNSEQAINLTLSWYKEYKNDAVKTTLGQVIDYFEK
jgi:CDP-glucose 4,6-dehydratase